MRKKRSDGRNTGVPAKRRAPSRKGMVVTTIALDEPLHQRLAIAAIEERAAITELVRQAVAEWLTRREGKTKRKGSR